MPFGFACTVYTINEPLDESRFGRESRLTVWAARSARGSLLASVCGPSVR